MPKGRFPLKIPKTSTPFNSFSDTRANTDIADSECDEYSPSSGDHTPKNIFKEIDQVKQMPNMSPKFIRGVNGIKKSATHSYFQKFNRGNRVRYSSLIEMRK